MHMNMRIIHEGHSESSSASEEEQLRECVSSAPGVAAVTEIKRHARGGYSVSVEHDGSVDELLAHIHAAGYRLVL
jgi:hypothetical protein